MKAGDQLELTNPQSIMAREEAALHPTAIYTLERFNSNASITCRQWLGAEDCGTIRLQPDELSPYGATELARDICGMKRK